MKKHHLVLLLAISAGIVFWFIDHAVHHAVQSGDIVSLFPVESWPHLFKRGWTFLVFLLFGLMVSRHIITIEKANRTATEAYIELKHIFEASPDALAFIATDNTVIRINEKAAALLGGTIESCIGKPCREAFHDYICNPNHCPMIRIRNGEEIVEYEFTIPGSDGGIREYALTATPCRSDSGALLGIVTNIRDITERKAIGYQLHHLLHMERMLAEYSTRFIHMPEEDIDGDITRFIEAVGLFSRVDRTYIFLFNDDCSIMTNTHEWCAEGIEPQIDNLKDIETSSLTQWMRHLRAFKNIHIPRLANLSDDWAVEKANLEPQGIQSLLVVPMAYRNTLIGFLGFDAVREEKKWTAEDIRLLNMAAETITSAIMRKRVDHELRVLADKREELDTIISRSPAVVFLWKNAPGWPVEFVSDNVARFGYTPQELMEGRVPFADIMHPGDVARIGEELDRFVAAGDDAGYNQEYRIITREGRVRWVDDRSWMRRNAQGEITHFQGVLLDITDRKKAEDALDFEHQQLLSIFDSIDEAIYVADPHTHEVLYVNRFLREMLPEDPLGAICYRAFQNFENPCPFCNNLTLLMDRDAVHQWEHFNPALNRYFILLDRLITWPDGRDVRFEMAVDVTPLKQAEERMSRLVTELEAKNRELEDFAYVVSHDLKAPLRAIGTLAEWISTDNAGQLDDSGKENLALLTSRVKRMHGLIEGVLKYSRLGRIRETMEQIDLNAEVADVIDLLAPPENVTVTVENHLPVVMAERTRIRQVFENLISNAIKFNDKPEGMVRIGCSSDDGRWLFRVTDNGPGIDEKYHDKIFKIFQTLQARDEYESTGIGLTLVKKIVTMYGGEVWVESKPGEGSSFVFTLPKSPAA